MFQFKAEFEDEYCGARDPDKTRKLCPGLQKFENWLRTHKDRIPIE
jgi:hypothetical protein